jgi:TRAP-type C4-dicarboxylate transport system substrate-binding protein
MKKWRVAPYVFVVLMALCFLVRTPAFGQTKPIDLYYSNQFPAPHRVSQLAVEWGKEIEKRTNGRVKVTMYAGGTLTPGDQCYDGVVKGLSHVGLSVFSYNAGKFPLTEVIDLPLGYKSGLAATRLINEYYKKFRPKELDEVKVMYLHANGPGIVHTRKPVNRLEEFKGLKVRATGTTGKIVQALGGTPVAMPMPDTYDALSRGVVEGVWCPVEALQGWRLGEAVKNTTLATAAASSVAMFVVMNKEKWNSFPQDVQKIIEQINQEWIEKQGAAWDEIDKTAFDYVKSKGHNFITLPPAEQQRWAGAVKPLLDQYVKSMKARGLPGDQVLKFCQDWLAAHQK